MEHVHLGLMDVGKFVLLLIVVGTLLRLFYLRGSQSSNPWIRAAAGAIGFIY